MSLEDDTDDEFRHRFSDNSVYKYAVDTAANMSYSLTVVAATEYFILDMEPEQVMRSRLGAITVNLFTSRVYGIYRDCMFRKFDVTEHSSRAKKYITDLLVFNSFCIPMYSGILTFAGADGYQVLGGMALMAGMSTFMGRTLGWWIDRVRRFAGVKTVYDITEDKDDEGLQG